MVYDTTPIAVTSLPQTNLTSKLLANAQDFTSFVLGLLGTIGANIATPVYFLEAMMIMVQEYAIAIMFVLLPLVVVVGLLPIFGNNYKLILKYAFSFFLIKLWIPVFWLIYVAMMDVTAILTASATPIHNVIHDIHNGIQYAITTFVGNTAYAQPIVSQTSGCTIKRNPTSFKYGL
jgi:TraG-like protein, N-terminal region.